MTYCKCDQCGADILDNVIPIKVICGYGSEFDGQELDFCSNYCVMTYFIIETGKEDNKEDTNK